MSADGFKNPRSLGRGEVNKRKAAREEWRQKGRCAGGQACCWRAASRRSLRTYLARLVRPDSASCARKVQAIAPAEVVRPIKRDVPRSWT